MCRLPAMPFRMRRAIATSNRIGSSRMYETFFGFVKRPFLAAPTLDRYFPASSMEQTLQTANRVIQRAEGPVAIFGGTGLGKSMCCLRIADNFRKNFEVVTLASSQLITRRALLQSLLFELRMPYRELSEGELRLTLMNRLQPSVENPTDGLVLIIDEAQTLSIKLLEEIRLLTNVVRNGQPRVRLVLCGTMKLEEILGNPQMESLSQRIAARCYLTPLSQEETCQYVIQKIELCGANCAQTMTREALDAIYRGSDGIPRLIDQLADQALLIASQEHERPVSSSMVGRAWCMLQQLPNPWSEPESIARTTPKSVESIVQSKSNETSSRLFETSTNNGSTHISLSGSFLPQNGTVSSAPVEFGQLEDFESDTDIDSDLLTFADETTNYTKPVIVPNMNSPIVIPTSGIDMTGTAELGTAGEYELADDSQGAASSVQPGSKNLFDVFAGDFDEEFVIPVQSSDSYQAYSGAAYGNLNYDINHFGESEENQLPPFAFDELTDEPSIRLSESIPSEWTDLEPVSNIPPEYLATIEQQIEAEMRELVSDLNMSAMTMDSDRDLTGVNVGGFANNTSSPEISRSLASHSHSDLLSFSGLHGSGGPAQPFMVSDDRDLLVIEEEMETGRNGAGQTAMKSSAVVHPYAKLFSKLRNS